MELERRVHEGLCPFSAVDIMELLKHDLDFLTVGCRHRKEVKALRTFCISSYPTSLETPQRYPSDHTFAFLTSAGVSSS